MAPIGELYAGLTERRFRNATPYRAKLPVICIGNFTAGGTGKTPLTRFMIEELAALGARPVCLTRGYGGTLAGPQWVEAAHTAREVGDEPLLLARDARVVVARDRKAGVIAIESDGATSVVLMDDGLQNPSVAKDLSLALVDAGRGFGNGRPIPAGPLRAHLGFQLGLVDGIVVMGREPEGESASVFERLKRSFAGPVLRASVEPQGDLGWIGGAAVIAYAGIANPERFFRLVDDHAPHTLQRRVFRDHHAFTEKDAAVLLDEAWRREAVLVTTEKDLARLAGLGGKRAELASRSRVVPIRVRFEERDALRLRSLLEGALKSVKA
jgi:tetraacyldisaccharide 4'-kinase